jgi:hypothetical protein
LALYLLITIKENNQDNLVSVHANDIINNFVNNGIDAGGEYAGKTIEITGIITAKWMPKDSRPLWDASSIDIGENINAEIKITCYFNDIIVHDLDIGQEVTLRCKYKNYYETKYGKRIIFRKGKITG